MKTKIKLIDRIADCLSSTKVQGYCSLCVRRIFNMDSRFDKKGMCVVFCYTAYEAGKCARLVQVLNPKDGQWALIDRTTGCIIARSETGFKSVQEHKYGDGKDQ